MDHIITIEELRSLGRPISRQIDGEKLESYIYETERLNIKPSLGDKLFSVVMKAACDQRKNVSDIEDRLLTLLDGGEYTDKRGDFHIFSGLRMAMSYYVYAQYVMDGDFQLTRAGVVVKSSDYSQHVSSKERSDCYNNAIATAKGFLSEVILYVKHAFPEYWKSKNTNAVTPHNAIIIKRIG